MLLVFVFRQLATRPFRDGAQFLLVIEARTSKIRALIMCFSSIGYVVEGRGEAHVLSRSDSLRSPDPRRLGYRVEAITSKIRTGLLQQSLGNK